MIPAFMRAQAQIIIANPDAVGKSPSRATICGCCNLPMAPGSWPGARLCAHGRARVNALLATSSKVPA